MRKSAEYLTDLYETDKVLSIDDIIRNLGLREKFTRGLLSDSEWLTYLDMQRILVLTGNQKKVHIASLAVLTLDNVLPKDRLTQLTTIPLLLDSGSEVKDQGTRWIAATVTIDPVERTVSCLIAESDDANHQAIMQKLLADAYPEWDIKTNFASSVNLIEPFACGYQALHWLFQQVPQQLSVSSFANSYSDIPAGNTRALVNAFYVEQFSSFGVDENAYFALNEQQRALFAKGDGGTYQVNKSVAAKRLSAPLLEPVRDDASALMSASVSDAVDKLDRFSSVLLFPGIPEPSISESDYEHLFTALQSKLVKMDIKLQKMALTDVNEKTLDGINAYYCGRQETVGFERLEMDIVAPLYTMEFIEKLKFALSSLSNNGLTHLVLTDSNNKIDEAFWGLIAEFIKKSNITISIDLPAQFADSALQKSIDESVSRNQRLKNQKALDAEPVKEAKPALKRTIKRVKKQTKESATQDIEIELQQEQAVEMPELNSGVRLKAEGAMGFGVIAGLDLEGFSDALLNGKLLLNSGAGLITQDTLKRYWHSWVGDVYFDKTLRKNNRVTQISTEALQQLLNHSNQFKDGINFDYLPNGFVLVPNQAKPELWILHYDKHALINSTDLATKLTDKKLAKPISFDVMQDIISRLNSGDARDKQLLDQWAILNELPYSRVKVLEFARAMPFLLKLNSDQLKKLLELCHQSGSFDANVLTHFINEHKTVDAIFQGDFEKNYDVAVGNELVKLFPGLSDSAIQNLTDLAHDLNTKRSIEKEPILLTLLSEDVALKKQVSDWQLKLSLNDQQMEALLAVYSEYGSQGLLKVFQVWGNMDVSLLQQLQETVFRDVRSYDILFTDKRMDDTLKSLSGLRQDKVRFQWMSTLLTQHSNAVGSDSLPALLDAFTVFSKRIQDEGLAFYPNISFKHVQSMPMALTCMLSVLDKCKPEDRAAQWACITEISLASDGAIRAMTDKHEKDSILCGFVVPEMRATREHCHSRLGYQINGEWKVIGSEAISLVESKQEFYRYLAHQKYRLPLAFYQSMEKQLVDLKFTDDQKKKLYAVLAKSTTGKNNAELSKNIDESTQNWNAFINVLIDPSVPVMKDQVRNNFINTFYNLGSPPALPILMRLMDLIQNTMKLDGFTINPVGELMSKAEILADACSRLNDITTDYDDAVYEGMKFYDEQTYTMPGEAIFYRHLNITESLANQFNFNYELLNSSLDKKLIKPMLSIISHFSLWENTAELNQKIISAYISAVSLNQNLTFDALSLLSDMERRSSPDLTEQELFLLLMDLISVTNACAADLVEKHFKNYFPANYFERLRMEQTPSNVVRLIESAFSGDEVVAVQTLLDRYTDPNATNDKLVMSEHLISILHDASKVEKIQALKEFNQLLDVDRSTITDFNALLVSIESTGHLNDVLFFLDKARKFESQPVEGLVHKSKTYLDKISPSMQTLYRDGLPKMATIDLVTNLLLASSKDQLERPVDVMLANQKPYDDLKGMLEGDYTTQALETQVNAFIQMQPDSTVFPELLKLSQHLKALHAPLKQLPIANNTPIASDSLIETAKFVVSSGFSYLKSWIITPVDETPLDTIFDDGEAEPPKTLDDGILTSAINELKRQSEDQHRYERVFENLFQAINEVLMNYPGDKTLIIDYFKYFVGRHTPQNDPMRYTWDAISLLKDEFLSIDDADIVRSLCENFNGDKPAFTPDALLTLLANEDYVSFSQDEKKLFLTIMTSLINSEKMHDLNDFTRLMARCRRSADRQVIIHTLSSLYQTAPYPELEQVQEWLDNASIETFADDVKASYATFDLQPCARESGNGFKLDFAREQVRKMEGVTYVDSDLQKIDKETKQVQSLPTREITAELGALREGKRTLSDERLLALMAELLYRTKGRTGVSVDGRQQPGHSFEINTTQYLALYAMLKVGAHVTSEIGTGEGKSRIMAIMNACQYAKGQTVDFITSDVQLATRDYLSFQPLYHALGAKTNLIYQHTPASEYVIGGINFSDAANLSIFRNKARSEGRGAFVIEPNKSKRALNLDEADRVYFDMHDIRFNYSSLADTSMSKNVWVYDVLIDFFKQAEMELLALYDDDPDTCVERLIEFAYSNVGKEKAQQLEYLSNAQLKLWLGSAIKALSYTLDQDFVIESPVEKDTAKGLKIVSEARLLIGNTESRNAKFSYGVHQCLHARLNRLKVNPAQATTNELKLVERLKSCEPGFLIDEEKQIVYSSSNSNMLDEYREGMLCAVTGTAGSIREREEAEVLYGTETSQMAFVNVPRHFGLHRNDFPLYLAADETAQRKLIIQQIKEARQTNQPVILICEDDKASELLMTYLQKELGSESLVRISSQTSPDIENTHINEHAGLPGMVTVSTGKIGRGTDIPLKGEASANGLRVLINYLPKERDFNQIIGRSGRKGAKGDSRLILNKVDLKKQLGDKSTLNDGFYTATERYIKQQYAKMGRKSQVDRLIKLTVSEFRAALTQNFFDDFFTQVDENKRPEVRQKWSRFFRETDEKWMEIRSIIQQDVNLLEPDVTLIEQHFETYQKFVASRWTQFKEEVRQVVPQSESLGSLNDVGNLVFTEQTKALLTAFSLAKAAPLTTDIADKYDPAHDGKAVLYRKPFEKFRAVLRGERPLFADFYAWREGRGILFPNFRAFWNGHMTFRQLVLGTGQSLPASERTEVTGYDKAGVSTSSARMLRALGPSLSPRVNQVLDETSRFVHSESINEVSNHDEDVEKKHISPTSSK